MDSINKQQPEKNREDLEGKQAITKLKELAEKAETCFFCTRIHTSASFATRPMAVLQVSDDGSCWFLSATDSNKNFDLAADPAVQLLFQASQHAGFMTLSGKVKVSRDKQKIKELWNPLIKTWFTEGVDDPRISVIQFIPETGYYWDTKHGQVVAFAKQVAGAITDKTLDDSIEGKLKI